MDCNVGPPSLALKVPKVPANSLSMTASDQMLLYFYVRQHSRYQRINSNLVSFIFPLTFVHGSLRFVLDTRELFQPSFSGILAYSVVVLPVAFLRAR